MAVATEAVVLGRGFQQLSSYHFNHQIKCVATVGGESVAVHYTVGSQYVTSVFPVTPHHHPHKRISTEKTVLHLLYVKKYRVYVMFCSDLTLRVYTDSFQHCQTLHTTSTALCLEFVESSSTLYIGESGYVKVWQLRHQLHCPLVPQTDTCVSMGKDQWVVGLDYEVSTDRLTATTESVVTIIDAKIHQSIATYTRANITGALLFSSYGYLILAFKNGSIHVLNTVLNAVVRELLGHTKPITALKRHNMGSSFLSCSLDGTVRVWDLDTLTECNRLDFGKEVLGMIVTCCGVTETAQLVCYSHQDVQIWQLHQLESHFATINCHTVALRRVESPGAAVRIMATAEDGCVRLLSPVTGQVITILFPVFTSTMLREVAYCPLGGLLFALLMTSEVLVLSTHTNPCSTLQRWTTRQRYRIETICICMVEWKERTHSLLFGGGCNGYIVLLHSSCFTMAQPCPAHGGCVSRLVSSESPVTLPDMTPTPSLVSFGGDNFLNVWSFGVNDRGDHIELKMLICIQMETIPKHIAIDGSLLCVTTAKNSVKMLNIVPELKATHQSRYLPHGCLFNSMPIMSHQREDRHTGTITSLSSCPALGLFATTSHDGHLKVWSTSSQLVSEIYFGDTLVSACFSNARGDLLVGFQRQICSVSASHYLPSQYLSHTAEQPYNSEDDPLTFDPTLEFWYDPERVPSYPVQLEERSKYCNSMLTDYYTTQSSSDQQMKSEQEMASRRSKADQRVEMADVQLTRRDSHHLLASLVPSTPSFTDGSHLIKRGSSECSSLSSLREAILNGLGAMRSQELASAIVNKRQSFQSYYTPLKRTTAPVERFPAEVAPLLLPSNKLPIAPDCIIPNSTIRETIGYVPAPDPLVLQQQQLATTIDRLLASSSVDITPRKMYRSKKRRSQRVTATDSILTDSETTLEPRETGTSLNSKSGDFDDNALEDGSVEISESGIKSTSTVTQSSPSIPYLGHSDNDDDSDDQNWVSGAKTPVPVVASTIMPDETSSSGSITALQPMTYDERSCLDDDHSDVQVVCSSNNERVKESNTVPIHVTRHSPSPQKPDPTPLVETKVVPTVTIPFPMGPTRTTVPTAPIPGSGQKSNVTSRVQEKSENHQMACDDVEVAETSKVLQRISTSIGFSPDLANNGVTTEAVCDGIVAMLNSVGAAAIRDISTALVELKEVSVLTEAQQSDIAQVLASRLASAKSSLTKQATLSALETLGATAVTDSVLMAVLPSLLDTNVDVRNSAFSTLKTIAGISSRSDLHHRLIEIGILQHIESDEDETLRGLSERLQDHSLTSGGSHRATRHQLQAASGTATQCDTSAGSAGCDASAKIISRVGERTLKPPRIQRAVTTRETSRNWSGRSSRRGIGSSKMDSGSRKQSRGSNQETISPLQRADMAIFQARLKCQPTLPAITTTVMRRRSNRTGFGHNLLIHDTTDYPKVNHNDRDKKLRRLLATHPTQFSQTARARELVVGAYTAIEEGRERRRSGGKFRWTEVFPVLGVSWDDSRGSIGRTNQTRLKSGTHPTTGSTVHNRAQSQVETSGLSTVPVCRGQELRQLKEELKLPRIAHD